MAQEPQGPAFNTVDEARAALQKGADVLAVESAKYNDTDTERKQLDFCAGCLLDLKSSLTNTKPQAKSGEGVNAGCS